MSLADRVAVMDHGKVRQLDHPLDLYRHPRSIFVADFIGSSTILRGAYANGQWVAPGLNAFEVGAECSSAIAVALRPESVALVAPTDLAARQVGAVSEVFFQGDHALAQVAVQEMSFLAEVRGDVLPARGDSVGLAWDSPAAIALFEE